MTVVVSKVNGVAIGTAAKTEGVTRLNISKINGVTRTSTLKTGIVVYYKLDETSGTTVTDATGTLNGTNSSATVNQTGKIGKAYSFASGNYLYVADNAIFDFSANDAFTVSGWYYFSSVSDINKYPSLFCKRTGNNANGFDLIMNRFNGSTTSLGCLDVPGFMTGLAGGWTANVDACAANTWYHIVLTATSTRVELWINGVSKFSETGTFAYVDNANNLDIGRRTSDIYADSVVGYIDEFAVWNRALSNAEIAELYNGGTGITYPF